ncbi:hypothetical protein ACHAXT_006813, partial [Thalassiosira profunda]
EQADFQDGLVDGAETEAAYEHTKNLLSKQCDCDDLVDECDEDIVPPEINVQDTLGLCGSSDLWFADVELAKNCPLKFVDTGLLYEASDNCGKPLNVTVDVYANEIEDFNAQEMALFYQTQGSTNGQAGLYVASGICSTESNGQCIKDDNAYDARRYTVVVSATDEADNSASAVCTYTILPKGNLNNKDVDFSDSTQKFLLTSYTTNYDTYVV